MLQKHLWHLIEQFGDVREILAYDNRDGLDPTRHQRRLQEISAEIIQELNQLLRKENHGNS